VSDPNIKTITSVQTGSGATAYCKVSILWGRTAAENINIVVGLPYNSVDGGAGGVQGRWNGRTQGIGGGGCSGNTTVTAATNAGYVGSGTDGGHAGGDCEPGVNLDGTYNVTFIDDWSRVGLKNQILYSKSLANTYYAQAPTYNYWNGCSTGGRQGYVLGQELPNELDGILAGAPAMYWTRFQTAQMWGQIVMKDMNGGVIIPTGKQNFATSKATAACDGIDGILDGIVDDPRACNYSAANDPSAICTANGGTSVDANCLTTSQAQAMDKIWDGPRNAAGNKIWYHSDPGSGTTVWNGAALFALAGTQFHWNEHDRNFDWHTVTMFGAGGTKSYGDVAKDGSTNQFLPGVSLADETDTFGNFDAFRAKGGKVLSYVGAYDNLIMHRGVIKYYREQASRYTAGSARNGGTTPSDFSQVQKFYRLYRVPNAGHCGTGNVNFFGQLVNWVENGVAPEALPATIKTGTVRLVCPYPQTAIYNGSGSTDVDANFHCGGSLETKEIVCKDILVKYKQETTGPLDYTNSGFSAATCGASASAQ
jgi:hypothetical protein